MASRHSPALAGPSLSKTEFVAIIAMLMALNALSVDIMLPALPAIDAAFSIADPNDRQLVVTAYMLGFAAGQPIYGPLSDRYGRKPVLMIGLVIFVLASLGTVLIDSFAGLLALRALQGIGLASPRVVGIAVVRDRFGGRDMARVMSFVMIVFVLLPVLAPAMGSGILLFGDWHLIFLAILAFGMLIAIWMQVRLPETRPEELREPLSINWIAKALKLTVASRPTLGYTVAATLVFGALLGYINSAQQIFVEIFETGDLFAVFFGMIAIALAVAAILNGSLVGRVGMRPLSHAAAIAYVLISIAHLAYVSMLDGAPSVWAFSAFLAGNLFCFGIMMPNFNAMAMEPLGQVAGTAASFVGCVTTAGAAIFGWYVGHLYDGTVVPLLWGYLVLGGLALVTVVATERGRLFRPHHARQAQ